jgi:hypothetical protein
MLPKDASFYVCGVFSLQMRFPVPSLLVQRQPAQLGQYPTFLLVLGHYVGFLQLARRVACWLILCLEILYWVTLKRSVSFYVGAFFSLLM